MKAGTAGTRARYAGALSPARSLPRTDTLDQLNERVPLSMARWHAHINLCLPQRGGAAHMDLAKFGLSGSIATAQACMEAGGRFFPQIFGWMVHVYPFEPPNQIWAQ